MESNKWKHTRQAKQKALSTIDAIYRWTWKLNGMGNYTIEAEDKKGSKGDAMFWSLLGRLNPGNHQLDRKDTLQDRLHLVVEECWSRIILEMQRGDCALEGGTKQPIYWALGGTAWSRISRWHLHANQISSFPSYVFCKPSDIGTETFWFKNDFPIYFYQMLKLMNF